MTSPPTEAMPSFKRSDSQSCVGQPCSSGWCACDRIWRSVRLHYTAKSRRWRPTSCMWRPPGGNPPAPLGEPLGACSLSHLCMHVVAT